MKFNSETTLLGNHTKKKILDVLVDHLKTCNSFDFSVSFIKISGLALLKSHIEDALKRGVKGRIVTSGYMGITGVDALNDLYNLQDKYPDQFEVYFLELTKTNKVFDSFHTKGYLFTFDNSYSMIIGSSNMSNTALSDRGGEWSLLSITGLDGELYKSVKHEFEENVKIIKYKLSQKQIQEYSQTQDSLDLDFGKVTPNFMQTEALKSLKEARASGKNKALIIAAMGSGKTYLAAFDAKQAKAKRILYVCESFNILTKARIEFENVLGKDFSYGMFGGGDKKYDADVLFATNASLFKELKKFDRNHFDYIIVDEAHHAPARTFSKIINYFNCDFLLGMTGTPDRMDQKNVRDIFGNAIPYELSLRDAINYDLIMPFIYKSINDPALDYSERGSSDEMIKTMVSPSHLALVKSEIEANRPFINGKLKCLAFCVRVDHAIKMSEAMNRIGYKTTYVTGDTPHADRDRIYRDLQDEDNPLEILFAVDLVNEGIDLPRINMSLFLRPTQSSIIFIQQLGRALRKSENKNKPIILDFIGDKYARSVYIAWALGELTNAPVLTKPILKNILKPDNESIKKIGVELHFDPESLKAINEHLDNCNFNTIGILQKSYEDFKRHYSLTALPSHTDFITKASGFDLMRIIQTHGSYYSFLHKINEPNRPQFNTKEIEFIEFLSEMLPLTRSYEFRILKTLVLDGPQSKDQLGMRLKGSIGDEFFSQKTFEHSIKYLKLETDSDRNQQRKTHFIVEKDGKYILAADTKNFDASIEDGYIELNLQNEEFRNFVLDLLNYGLVKFEDELGDKYIEFKLHHPYSRREFTRVVNLDSVVAFQPGVYYFDEKKRVALFIDLIKGEDVEEHLNYGDEFLSKKEFIWESQTNTEIGNKRYNKLTSIPKVEIFVRKFKKEDGISLPYIYLGKGTLTNPTPTENEKKTLKFNVLLDDELTDELFEQFNIKEY